MDNFALLGQPRRPWLDLDALKIAFLERSAQVHPDHVPASERPAATNRYAELNAAYNCLRDPKERLGHLLELEQGAPPANVQNIPPGTMDLFVQIGQSCREADRIVAAKAAATSPLLQAQWFVQGAELAGKLGTLLNEIQLQRERLLAELRAMNHAWKSGTMPLQRLEEIYRIFSYTSRWTAQLQDRFAQLSI